MGREYVRIQVALSADWSEATVSIETYSGQERTGCRVLAPVTVSDDPLARLGASTAAAALGTLWDDPNGPPFP